MATPRQARKVIGDEIRENHSGVYAFAEAVGVHFTSIYSFLAGGGMSAKNAAKLRAALPSIEPSVWDAMRITDGFAPCVTSDEDVAAGPTP